MKKSITAAVLLLFLAVTSNAEPTIPPPQGFVNDFASKLTPDTKQKLESLLENFRNRTGVEVAVVTMNFDDLQGYPISDYSVYLGRQWGLGRDSEKRALVLLAAIKPPESNGSYHGATWLTVSRHLEGDIPDGLAGEITRTMRNDFQSGQFDQALTKGTQTILATVAERLGVSIEGIDSSQAYRRSAPAGRTKSGRRGLSPFLIIVIVFVFLAIIHALGGRGGRGGPGGRHRRGGSGLDWMILPIILGSGRGGWGGGSSDSGWGGGGGDSGGGGFGGFGGGGDFGGGGAGDNW